MGACFQPGVNKIVIYASLIEQIYEEAQHVPDSLLKQYSSIHPETPYLLTKPSTRGYPRKGSFGNSRTISCPTGTMSTNA